MVYCVKYMSLIYRARRIGKHGRPFFMLKLRTLKDGSDTTAFPKDTYTWCGRFLRKFRIDELPQLFNILRGDMSLFGIRPQEERTLSIYPEHVYEKIISQKPGLVSPASIFFYDEEKILRHSENPHEDYWTKIYPIKLALDCFYIENRSILMNLALLWAVVKLFSKEAFKSLYARL